MAKTICLVMIVKDEEHILGSTLENICQHMPIADFCITDTGSSDSTVSIIETFFASKSIPGRVCCDEWVNFGHNRNKSLENARKFSSSEYLMVFDADDCFRGDTRPVVDFVNAHDADVYTLVFGHGQKFHRSILFRRSLDAMYIGVIHEYLQFPPTASNVLIPGDYYVDARTLGSRNKNPHKYRDDALMLEKAFAQESSELRCRYCFYIAQSYFDAKMFEESKVWYARRLTLGGFEQEKYYSCVRLGYMLCQSNEILKGVDVWLGAFQYDPDRVECLVYAMFTLMQHGFHSLVCQLYHANKHKSFKFSFDKVFADPIVYNENVEFIYSVSAYYAGEREGAMAMTRQLLASDSLQLDMTLQTVQNAYSFYEWKQLPLYERIRLVCDVAKQLLRLVEGGVSLTREALSAWTMIFSHVRPSLTQLPVVMAAPMTHHDVHFIVFCGSSLDTLASVAQTWSDIGSCAQVTVLLTHTLWTCKELVQRTFPRAQVEIVQPSTSAPIVCAAAKIRDLILQSGCSSFVWLSDPFVFFRPLNYVGLAHETMERTHCDQVILNAQRAASIDQGLSTFDAAKAGVWSHFSLFPSLIRSSSWLANDPVDVTCKEPIEHLALQFKSRDCRVECLSSLNYTME